MNINSKYKQDDRDHAQEMPSEKYSLIENHCQPNISKGRHGNDFITFCVICAIAVI